MAKSPEPLWPDVIDLIRKKRLPTTGTHPLQAMIKKSRSGRYIVAQAPVLGGRKAGHSGCVDLDGNHWRRDPAHGGYPDHWDVQLDAGADDQRVGDDGHLL